MIKAPLSQLESFRKIFKSIHLHVEHMPRSLNIESLSYTPTALLRRAAEKLQIVELERRLRHRLETEKTKSSDINTLVSSVPLNDVSVQLLISNLGRLYVHHRRLYEQYDDPHDVYLTADIDCSVMMQENPGLSAMYRKEITRRKRLRCECRHNYCCGRQDCCIHMYSSGLHLDHYDRDPAYGADNPTEEKIGRGSFEKERPRQRQRRQDGVFFLEKVPDEQDYYGESDDEGNKHLHHGRNRPIPLDLNSYAQREQYHSPPPSPGTPYFPTSYRDTTSTRRSSQRESYSSGSSTYINISTDQGSRQRQRQSRTSTTTTTTSSASSSTSSSESSLDSRKHHVRRDNQGGVHLVCKQEPEWKARVQSWSDRKERERKREEGGTWNWCSGRCRTRKDDEEQRRDRGGRGGNNGERKRRGKTTSVDLDDIGGGLCCIFW